MPGILLRLSGSLPGRLTLSLAALLVAGAPYPFLNAGLAPRFDLSTPLDAALPLLPATIVLYWSWLLLLAATPLMLRGSDFLALLGSLVLCCLLCYAGFALFTAEYPRPAPADFGPAWSRGYEWLHAIDGPGNTFPSLHVAASTTVALHLRSRRGGALWVAAALLVAASTLTTKQHFVADLLAGVALAGAVYAGLARLRAARA